MKFQLQNIPRQYKKFFVAKDGWKVMEFDGAGMEFRIAAILGRDKQAEADIVGGADVHAFTRDTMNEAYIRYNIDKQIDRQEAKSSTFTPLFWGRGKDEAEQEYAIAFAKKYSGIRDIQQDWVNMVADKKYLETPYGMRYYWPNAKMLRNGYVTGTTEIVNIPIQGLATAECIPISLVHFWHRTRYMPVQLFNTVHDSGVCRVREDYVEQAMEAAKLAMTTDVYQFLKDVYRYDTGTCPLGVGFKVGDAWGESDVEIIYDVWSDGHERKTVKDNDSKHIEYDTRSST
jgi:DNA polymerase-1